MYLTCNKNETKEIIRLGLKFGKTIYVPSYKHLALNEVYLPPKRTTPNPRFEEMGVMPPPRPKFAKKDICTK